MGGRFFCPAPAVLEQRKQSAQSNIKRFGKNFGSAGTRQKPSVQEQQKIILHEKKKLGLI